MSARRWAAAGACLLLGACGESARLPEDAAVGERPALVAPRKTLLPTVRVAEAEPWRDGEAPQAARGARVQAFASGLAHPRWLHVLPNGDVLVAESNGPPRPDDGKGIKAWFMKQFMSRAGAAAPSADRITLLRDANGDGRAEERRVFLERVPSPIGMATVGDRFYVAATDAVWEYTFDGATSRVQGPGRRLTDLPAGSINHHWTKNLIASADGSRLYATVGSNSNVAENGIEAEEGRAAIWEIDCASGSKRLFATGLRNPNGMAWEPSSGALWAVVNERDELGSDLVPDYLTRVRDGGFYGWPYSWYGTHVDTRVQPERPDLVAQAIVPDYALGTHVAPLGLAASGSTALTRLLSPAEAVEPAAAPAANGAASAAGGAAPAIVAGMFIGLHGSWNRDPPSGYKVVYVAFSGGRPQGMPVDVLTGFLSPEGHARGRPVGVAIDRLGALLVADDVGNTVWRVSAP